MDIYVIDTSALLRDADILNKLSHAEVIIHTLVIEELESLSRKNNSIGACARKIGDKLYELRNRGDFKKGIKMRNGLIVKFDDTPPKIETYLRFGLDPAKNDNLLLCVAKEIQEKTGKRTILLTADKFMCLKAVLDLEIQMVTRNFSKKKLRNKGYRNFNRKAFNKQ